MQHHRFAPSAATLAALAVLASTSLGLGGGMPSGTRQFIQVESNETAPPNNCGVGSLPDPSPNYVADPNLVALGFRICG